MTFDNNVKFFNFKKEIAGQISCIFSEALKSLFENSGEQTIMNGDDYYFSRYKLFAFIGSLYSLTKFPFQKYQNIFEFLIFSFFKWYDHSILVLKIRCALEAIVSGIQYNSPEAQCCFDLVILILKKLPNGLFYVL